MSTRAKCMIFDFPLPIGSMWYRDASTTPLTPPKSKCASGWATLVSTITQAPRGKSALHDLELHWEFSENSFIFPFIYAYFTLKHNSQWWRVLRWHIERFRYDRRVVQRRGISWDRHPIGDVPWKWNVKSPLALLRCRWCIARDATDDRLRLSCEPHQCTGRKFAMKSNHEIFHVLLWLLHLCTRTNI